MPYSGKVQLLKCPKKSPLLVKQHYRKACAYLVINFPHEETYLSWAREQRNLTLIETFIPSKVLVPIKMHWGCYLRGLKVERNLGFLSIH